MIPNTATAVGDVEEREDDWRFMVVNTDLKASICFVFKGRKEATVSRRLMKEILARSVAIAIADYPPKEMPSPPPSKFASSAATIERNKI